MVVGKMIFGLKNFKKGPSSLRGVLCMLGGALSLTINDAMAKYLTQSYPVGQVMALRGLSIIMLLIAFLFLMNNLKALKIFSWKGHLLRAGAMTGSTFFYNRAESASNHRCDCNRVCCANTHHHSWYNNSKGSCQLETVGSYFCWLLRRHYNPATYQRRI